MRVKLANHVAKSAVRKPGSYPEEFGSVCNLAALPGSDLDAVLGATPVEDVWGVGRKIGAQLTELGVTSALDLANLNPSLARKRWSVVLERTVRELRGENCIALDDAPAAKQQIACTRSFGERISDLSHLTEAISAFASRAAEKLRQQESVAGQVLVFIQTSPFGSGKQYAKSANVRFPRPTADTRLIVNAAIKGLQGIYRSGYDFAKAGVMLMDIGPAGAGQGWLDLFAEDAASPELMHAMDRINAKYGRGSIRVAASGAGEGHRPWQMRQELRTPHYTTRIADIPIARA